MKQQRQFLLTFLWVTMAILQFTVFTQSVFSSDLPERPDPGLPTRPTLPSPPQEDNNEEAGAWIRLKMELQDQDFWTVVQWQDSSSHWHDVDGWRGYSRRSIVQWFVQKRDFDKGPFRWQVYDQPGGALVDNSDKFYLPKNRTEVVIISLAPDTVQDSAHR